ANSTQSLLPMPAGNTSMSSGQAQRYLSFPVLTPGAIPVGWHLTRSSLDNLGSPQAGVHFAGYFASYAPNGSNDMRSITIAELSDGGRPTGITSSPTITLADGSVGYLKVTSFPAQVATSVSWWSHGGQYSVGSIGATTAQVIAVANAMTAR
ncbi:MAG: hypothetical protein ACRD0E_10595, partial [Acidimicrobiales bacterium]